MRLNILKMFKCLMARGTIFFDIANFYCHNKFAYVHNLRSILQVRKLGCLFYIWYLVCSRRISSNRQNLYQLCSCTKGSPFSAELTKARWWLGRKLSLLSREGNDRRVLSLMIQKNTSSTLKYSLTTFSVI